MRDSQGKGDDLADRRAIERLGDEGIHGDTRATEGRRTLKEGMRMEKKKSGEDGHQDDLLQEQAGLGDGGRPGRADDIGDGPTTLLLEASVEHCGRHRHLHGIRGERKNVIESHHDRGWHDVIYIHYDQL